MLCTSADLTTYDYFASDGEFHSFLETLRALSTDIRATEYHQRGTMKLYDQLIYSS